MNLGCASGRDRIVRTRADTRNAPSAQPTYFLGLMGVTVPDFGFGTSNAWMPWRQRSSGLPMRARKAASDVTTWRRVIGERR
jgi:hypothetical protein